MLNAAQSTCKVPKACIAIVTLMITGCSNSTPGVHKPETSQPTAASSTNGGAAPDSVGLPMTAPIILPVVSNPRNYSVAVADVPDDTRVIGVIVGNDARAYVCDAMAPIDTHVINDLIGTKSDSVTDCDKTDCARVFHNSRDAQPLNLQVGGLSGDAMVVRFDGKMYLQTSEEIPRESYESVRTTWGEWKVLHPQTSIFSGGTSDARSVI
jgi:hypothetical protein